MSLRAALASPAVSNGSNTCQYPEGNTAQETACLKQVSPLTAVDCTPHFRSVTDCASVCTSTPPP